MSGSRSELKTSAEARCQSDGRPRPHRWLSRVGLRRTEVPDGPGRVYLGRDVRIVEQDEMARLIDLESIRFFVLDPIGTRLLSLSLTQGESEALRLVAEEYDVPRERVQADWKDLAHRLRRKKLIGIKPHRAPDANAPPASLPANCRAARLPGRMALSWLLAWAWVCLRIFGWAATVRSGQRRSVALRPEIMPDEHAALQAADQMIRDAASRHWLNTECKERSLVLWRILREYYGLSAELVVGVVLFPFKAHAWIVCGSQVLTDDPESCREFTIVERYS